MKKKITIESLVESLSILGIKKGDVIFLSADLMRVGYFNKNIETTLKDWVNILLTVVGENGTLIIPANTDLFWFFNKKNDFVFTADRPPNSGSLSLAFFKYADVIRSTHPTNSCFGIGPEAKNILCEHHHESLSYSLYGKIIDLSGKNLMLGTVEDRRNSPMPFHYCQEILGHTVTHPYAKMQQCYRLDEAGEKVLYTRKDVGGCTRGAINTFGEHISAKAITFGKVGKSLSALVDCKKSQDLLLDIFVHRPNLIRCSEKECMSCYGRFVYNGFGVVPFYIKFVFRCTLKAVKYIKKC